MAFETTDHTSDAGHLEPMIEWLRENRSQCGRPVIPFLRRKYGVSALDACKILRLARLRDDWPAAAEDQGGAHAEAS
ncbi:hypothetical protein CK218_10885 [Mesorhizobium sp. WSM3879]|uniref:hypothetical protein n=1 Tax=Mesorhizobium sp. WSM3879 TaxID=2029406 RepID=UPI000BAED1C2|nr:hypothetical protein [Mesorhizobium sp. WSM3879]PBB80907.1 hypothetical protein CK218_10885 [Mesorhizobium sp. WSM3879]